jgi:hypothetical protein
MEKLFSMDTLALDDSECASYAKERQQVRKKWEGKMGGGDEDGEGLWEMTNDQ